MPNTMIRRNVQIRSGSLCIILKERRGAQVRVMIGDEILLEDDIRAISQDIEELLQRDRTTDTSGS